MKKFLFLLVFAFSFVATDTAAQNWLKRVERALNSYDQRHQQRTIPRNNSQQAYPNMQRYGLRERANQQRRDEQQREYMQQKQRSRVSDEESRTITTVHTDANNTTQDNDKVVSLVVNGTGSTKEEATKNALRSAIEQAFGTFVSSNTAVLDDELIKDEIVTVSTGNIKTYNVLSSSLSSSGLYDVSVQAVVSIDQLTKFAQSKGMQTELAGASFVMNMKIRELNKKNEVAAIDHMIEKVIAIAQNGLFDYKLEIGEPQLTNNSNYAVKVNILFYENENTKAFYNTIYNTFESLGLSKSDIAEYQRANMDYYAYNKQLINGRNKQLVEGSGMYVLRNKFQGINYNSGTWSYPWIMPILMEYALKYEIKDNIGNVWRCKIEKDEYYKKYDNIEKQCQLIWEYDERIDLESKYMIKNYYYILSPSDRIVGVTAKYRKEGMVTLNVPIKDFGNDRIDNLHFNPLISDDIPDGGFQKRITNRLYFQQEFFIIYSQDELSKLNSITISHR
jgi:hypothetical protein